MLSVRNEPEPKLEGLLVLERLQANAWKAIDEKTCDLLAIKSSRQTSHPSPEHLSREHEYIQAVHEYAQTALGMSASTVVRVRDFLRAQCGAYLVTHFVAEDISHLYDATTETIIRAGVSMLDTLGLVHRAGLRHNDTKPANWRYIPTLGEPLLIDFSLATPKDESTQPIGTFEYSSPQQLLRQEDPRADVFTVGVILYELLTGEMPFPEGVYERELSLPARHLHQANLIKKQRQAWDVPREHADMPQSVYETVQIMLSYDQAQRPSLLDARNSLASSIGLSEKPPLPRA